ncbi:MAG TPA: ABC transporter ATP-binding protein/permease [Clostridiales bacterium]|nr:ABC transporter ATP-binding protein/permease [Clostridiales bacterium]
MLKLQSIYKEYQAGDTTVHALKDINIEFRKNEFVSILGPSGCGKTTMLNIIGGLDRYTKGDLSINGKSTKEFKDTDWDSYRNHSIGFVFQNYNLIPHQTVLSNVELALTLSGVSKAERRQRATDALTRVGLADQLHKKPNQMSGGQMQRVAIARALVNNPEILLADEPTGALDSETSVQIMEILKEIAKEKLIIMVTHNPDLAKKYSTRIIRLFDGNIKSDSDPYEVSEFSSKPVDKAGKSRSSEKKALMKKTSMSMFTALSLSMNNLLTKKTRTFMTAFAGSIGIIGIALILSLSNGIQSYIDNVQKDTLSAYPIIIEKESVDMTSLMTSIVSNQNKDISHELDKVYSNPVMGNMVETMVKEVKTNNLEAFKKELDRSDNTIASHASTVQYGYSLDLNIYSLDVSDGIMQLNPSSIFSSFTQSPSFPGMGSMYSSQLKVWEEMLNNQELLNSQYDVLSGRWPTSYDEVVLMVDENNEISDIMIYALGLKDPKEMEKVMSAAMKGEVYETKDVDFAYDELLSKTFKLVLPSDYYKYDKDSNTWKDMREDKAYMADLVEQGTDLKIVGIIRPNADAVSTSMSGAIGYTSALTDYVISRTNENEIVKQQLSAPGIDVFSGIEFSDGENRELTMEDVNAYVATLDEETRLQTEAYISTMPEDQVLEMFQDQITLPTTDASYEGNLQTLGIVDMDNPSTISLYASSFDEKEAIADAIQAYNTRMKEDGKEEYVIQYTDIVGLMMSSVSSIINVISYVLIAFVAISLVVSSIMIGIITYISVLERTKEIGILRSIGASKRDISRVFNAETLIVGFVSGLLGIVITVLLNLPINMIIKAVSGISGVSAALPLAGGVILIIISMFLTLLGGFIPSKIAAKKDPVVALRSE